MAATQESTRLSRMKGYGSNAFAASSVLTSIHKISTPVKEKMNSQLPANLTMASAARWPRVYFSAEGLTDILLSASRFSTSSSVISWRISLSTSFNSFLFSFMIISPLHQISAGVCARIDTIATAARITATITTTIMIFLFMIHLFFLIRMKHLQNISNNHVDIL